MCVPLNFPQILMRLSADSSCSIWWIQRKHLKKLITHLRPGGIVAFQDIDFTIYPELAHPETPLLNNLIKWGISAFERSGGTYRNGHRIFTAPSLTQGCLSLCYILKHLWEAPPSGQVTPSSPTVFRSIQPLIEAYGIATAEELDVDNLPERLRAEVVASKRPLCLATTLHGTRHPGFLKNLCSIALSGCA